MGGTVRHDDIQGIIGTALTGVTSYTMRQYRTTGLVYPHVANNDIFTMTFQLSHRKQLGVAMDDVHIHYIPIASADGDIRLDYEWGWYNHDDVVPATLPNTGNKVITLATTDQYKLKIDTLLTNLAVPVSGNDMYSSILFIKVARGEPAGTNWGNNNEIAIVYMDAHFPTERNGSINSTTD
jgi:hypothetical protein